MSLIVTQLMNRIEATITPLLAPSESKKFILADIPDHANVGDSAITLGELAFLRRHYPSTKIRGFPMNLYNEKAYPEMESSDVIFLHGGGNFGDIWPLHHNIRLKIIEKFPHKRIIQFPQSISFSDKGVLRQTQDLIAKAKRFTLLVRDHKSLSFAQENFECETILCPDMAFSLGPLQSAKPVMDYSCLLRTDKEVLEEKVALIQRDLTEVGASFEINDWLKNRFLEKVNIAARRTLRANLPSDFLVRHGLPLLERYARARVDHGIALLGKGRVVITDRLHGYIISTLMDRERYVFDSLDGKIRAFHDAWLSGEERAVFLNSTDELKTVLQNGKGK